MKKNQHNENTIKKTIPNKARANDHNNKPSNLRFERMTFSFFFCYRSIHPFLLSSDLDDLKKKPFN